MKRLNLTLDEKAFNLLWRSLHDREATMQESIANEPSDSDEAALLANDLVYLRLYKAELQRAGVAAQFPDSAFSLGDETLDLSSFTKQPKSE